ncbi:hypothetical protein Ancab_016488 [Ancistrocladus abbreviatus]
MEYYNKTEKARASSDTTDTAHLCSKQICTNPHCFFCIMNEHEALLRRAKISNCFKKMPLVDSQENVIVLSGLWNIAMTHPDDPEFPSLGIFECMKNLIQRGINDREWLLRDQNMYIPYYAAHIVGSYTMNSTKFAEKAVQSGVIPPLLELLRGKISWVEQRVAVRALGHLASYEATFEALKEFEEEVVELTMHLASTCLEVVYKAFVGIKDKSKRLAYHSDLLTRGVGGMEIENRKAEEWASQLQCWSLHLLNCFAYKERSLSLICRPEFLKDLCSMLGGLVNDTSPAGFGLIRILCYSKLGRKRVAEMREVVVSLCNLSRSSDDWQYIGIDCLLLLLKDPDTRYKVIDIASLFLVDLAELRSLGGRSNMGEAIINGLLSDHKERRLKPNKTAQSALREIWALIDTRKREKMMNDEEFEERRVLLNLIKQQGNQCFWSGEVEEALIKYSEALGLCPLKLRKDRIVLYSNRAQCHLLLRDPDAAVRDTTRALCLSTPANSHKKSLWRRSQAYDMKGLAKESLMDCIMFINCSIKSKSAKHVKIPYHAARMITKQMDAMWIFSNAQSKLSRSPSELYHDNENKNSENHQIEIARMQEQKQRVTSGWFCDHTITAFSASLNSNYLQFQHSILLLHGP